MGCNVFFMATYRALKKVLCLYTHLKSQSFILDSMASMRGV
jgi:hypothetical protein